MNVEIKRGEGHIFPMVQWQSQRVKFTLWPWSKRKSQPYGQQQKEKALKQSSACKGPDVGNLNYPRTWTDASMAGAQCSRNNGTEGRYWRRQEPVGKRKSVPVGYRARKWLPGSNSKAMLIPKLSLYHSTLYQWLSKCIPEINNITVTRELVSNAHSWDPPQPYWLYSGAWAQQPLF